MVFIPRFCRSDEWLSLQPLSALYLEPFLCEALSNLASMNECFWVAGGHVQWWRSRLRLAECLTTCQLHGLVVRRLSHLCD